MQFGKIMKKNSKYYAFISQFLKNIIFSFLALTYQFSNLEMETWMGSLFSISNVIRMHVSPY